MDLDTAKTAEEIQGQSTSNHPQKQWQAIGGSGGGIDARAARMDQLLSSSRHQITGARSHGLDPEKTPDDSNEAVEDLQSNAQRASPKENETYR